LSKNRNQFCLIFAFAAQQSLHQITDKGVFIFNSENKTAYFLIIAVILDATVLQ